MVLDPDLLGDEDPFEDKPILKISSHGRYLRDLLDKYSEIAGSLERMKLSLAFIRNLSVSKKHVKPIVHLRYHHEFYLSEVYVYEERIKSLLVFLERRCKKAKLDIAAKEIQDLNKKIKKALSGVRKTRGSHVHDHRYQNRKIEQLELLSSLSKDFDFIAQYHDIEIRKYKQNLIKELEQNIKTFESIVEEIIPTKIGDIIFGKLLWHYKEVATKEHFPK